MYSRVADHRYNIINNGKEPSCIWFPDWLVPTLSSEVFKKSTWDRLKLIIWMILGSLITNKTLASYSNTIHFSLLTQEFSIEVSVPRINCIRLSGCRRHLQEFSWKTMKIKRLQLLLGSFLSRFLSPASASFSGVSIKINMKSFETSCSGFSSITNNEYNIHKFSFIHSFLFTIN